ncbi:MAG: YihY/virulence factor BrkB family protein [Ilumatobacteraceae bacterium]
MSDDPDTRPPDGTLRRLDRFVRAVVDECRVDNVADLAAAVTFWTVLSIPAAALALVSVLGSLGSVIGESLAADLRREVESFVASTFTEGSAINTTVADLFDTRSTGVATVSTALALITLSRAFAGLVRALDVAYDVEDRRPWWRLRLAAIGLGGGSIVVVVAGVSLLAVLPRLPIAGELAWLIAPGTLVVMVLWVATVYHIGPHHRTPWRFDLPGAVFTVIGWVAATQAFAWYVRFAPSGNDIRNTVGAVLLAFTLLYLLSLLLLVGAEVNDVLARRAGVVAPPRALQVPGRPGRRADTDA